MAKGDARVVLTPTIRMLYPNILEARPYMENGKAKGEPRFGSMFILEPEDLDNFKEAGEDGLETVSLKRVIFQVAKQDFDDVEDLKAAFAANEIARPYKDGTKWSKKKSKFEDILEGKYLLSAHSNQDYPPAVKAMINGKMTALTRGLPSDEAKIKSLFAGGNYAFAELNVKGTEVSGNKRVTCYLNAICFVKPGERIGGGGSLMDRMEGVSGGEADVDPTDEDLPDDEIPF